MKLVLGAGINPRVAKHGPRVHIYAGSWRFTVEHGVDSCFSLHSEGTETPIETGQIFHSKGQVFQLEIKNGTESYINVFAEYVKNDPKSTKPA